MRLTKREIGIVSTEELNYRYCHLLQKGEKIPANEFPITEVREILWIEDEMHQRVIRAIGHDFYPPGFYVETKPLRRDILIERNQPHGSASGRPQIEATQPHLKPEIPKSEPGVKIRFKVIIKSAFGCKAAGFMVEAETKAQAEMLAAKQIQKLGLKRATFKIS